MSFKCQCRLLEVRQPGVKQQVRTFPAATDRMQVAVQMSESSSHGAFLRFLITARSISKSDKTRKGAGLLKHLCMVVNARASKRAYSTKRHFPMPQKPGTCRQYSLSKSLALEPVTSPFPKIAELVLTVTPDWYPQRFSSEILPSSSSSSFQFIHKHANLNSSNNNNINNNASSRPPFGECNG